MGKTFEALRRAEDEYQERLSPVRSRSFSPRVRQQPRSARSGPAPLLQPRLPIVNSATEPYEDLKTNLLARHPEESFKTVLFLATSNGSGCTTTAVNFAAVLARNTQLKVLIAEVNLRTPSRHKAYKAQPDNNLRNFLIGDTQNLMNLRKVRPWNFYVLGCGGNHYSPLHLLESSRFDQFLNMVREKFDYIILDGPPVPFSSEFRIISTKVDGVVLVVDSGRSRRQVVHRAKQQLEEVGANILGVVLNRKKHYIPEWIYTRL